MTQSQRLDCQVRCNKALLSARSQRFRALFSSGMMESRQEAHRGTHFRPLSNSQVETSLEVFQCFLSYVYKDFADINEENAVETLIFASGKRSKEKKVTIRNDHPWINRTL